MIKEIYDGAKTQVSAGEGDSDHFLFVLGLHQNLALSPFLFSIAMDMLMWHIKGKVP